VTATVTVDNPYAMAVDGTSVWVTNGGRPGTVSKIRVW
jgi:hypothetical protein